MDYSGLSQELREEVQSLEKQHEYLTQQNRHFLEYAQILWFHWRNLKALSEADHRLVSALSNRLEVARLKRHQEELAPQKNRLEESQPLQAQEALLSQELTEAIQEARLRLRRLDSPALVSREEALVHHSEHTEHRLTLGSTERVDLLIEQLKHLNTELHQKNKRWFDEAIRLRLSLMQDVVGRLERRLVHLEGVLAEWQRQSHDFHDHLQLVLEQLLGAQHHAIGLERKRLNEVYEEYRELEEAYYQKQHDRFFSTPTPPQPEPLEEPEPRVYPSPFVMAPLLTNPWKSLYE